jgi:hypothetical protein
MRYGGSMNRQVAYILREKSLAVLFAKRRNAMERGEWTPDMERAYQKRREEKHKEWNGE